MTVSYHRIAIFFLTSHIDKSQHIQETISWPYCHEKGTFKVSSLSSMWFSFKSL